MNLPRPITAGAALALTIVLGSCMGIPTLKSYAGPDLPEDQVALVRRDIFDQAGSVAKVWITAIDPAGAARPRSVRRWGYAQAAVLPGEHEVAGIITAYTGDHLGSGTILTTPAERITFTAEAGRLYMLKGAFDPAFVATWHEAHVELMDEVSADQAFIEYPNGEKVGRIAMSPGAFWFWVEDTETGECVAGHPSGVRN